ncbi:hypothetical protein QL285_032925 [Trifolium repens]|nr:hypothetical protein QL285_032925 [Trifolium repens]
MDNCRDANDVEMNNGNDMHNEEGEEDLDGYTPIDQFTDDDIREMEFDSEQKVVDFYEIRGKRHKKHMLRVDRSRVPRPITRTDCRARIHVAYNVETRHWRVVAFESAHNHELTPRRFVHFIPKYRQLSEADKALVDGLHTCVVITCHILGFMMAKKGGHEDCHNTCEKSNRPKENMPDTNKQDIPMASAFVTPNHSLNIDSNVETWFCMVLYLVIPLVKWKASKPHGTMV